MEMEFCFHLFPLKKSLKVPFPFVSVKMNFKSSAKLPFPLAAACFHVTPKEVTRPVEFHLCGLQMEMEMEFH